MSKFRQQLVHASASHPMITEDTVQHVQQIFDNLAGELVQTFSPTRLMKDNTC